MTSFWQPTLSDPLVLLTALKAGDRTRLYAAAADPLIWQNHAEPERFLANDFNLWFDKTIAADGGLLIVEKAGGAVIGCARFYEYRPDLRQVAIGTFLIQRCWGKGFNLAVKRLMIEHALRRVDRVVFYVTGYNHRSRRALEKIGAAIVQRQVMRLTSDGRLVPHMQYQVNCLPADRLGAKHGCRR